MAEVLIRREPWATTPTPVLDAGTACPPAFQAGSRDEAGTSGPKAGRLAYFGAPPTPSLTQKDPL
jgi:hypothetical protein